MLVVPVRSAPSRSPLPRPRCRSAWAAPTSRRPPPAASVAPSPSAPALRCAATRLHCHRSHACSSLANLRRYRVVSPDSENGSHSPPQTTPHSDPSLLHSCCEGLAAGTCLGFCSGGSVEIDASPINLQKCTTDAVAAGTSFFFSPQKHVNLQLVVCIVFEHQQEGGEHQPLLGSASPLLEGSTKTELCPQMRSFCALFRNKKPSWICGFFAMFWVQMAAD